MEISLASIEDAQAINTLILESAFDCKDSDFSDTGWERFLSSNDLAATRSRISDARYLLYLAYTEGTLAGIITLFEQSKIDQLFVLKKFRSLGIAKALWEKVLSQCHSPNGYVWVRSSSMAIPVYESFGFKTVSEKQVSNGIAFTQMEYNFDIR